MEKYFVEIIKLTIGPVTDEDLPPLMGQHVILLNMNGHGANTLLEAW